MLWDCAAVPKGLLGTATYAVGADLMFYAKHSKS